MTVRARAAVVRTAGAAFEMVDVELPEPGPGQLLVRVAGTGMCQTDLHVRAGTLYPVPFPAILGHECAGTVEVAGEGVTGLVPGDRVVVTFAWCGHCRACAEAHVSYCERAMPMNYTEPARFASAGGDPVSASFFGQSSFATHVVCEARSAVRVEVEAGRLDLLGPLACSVQTGAGSVLFAARAGALDAVVVFGAGAVGLSAVMAAHAAGARRVVAVDVNSARLRLASELGADATVDGSAEDTSKGLRRVEPGGFDVAIDCTGSPAVMIPALRALRSTGRFFLVGVPAPGSKVDLEPGRLFGKTMTGVVQGDSYPPAGIPALVDLWSSGRLPLERLVTRFPLEAVEDAAAQMRSGAVVKPVLVP